MDIRKVVIPVAGAGTRLLPVTKSQPKEMLPVGRKPVVQYVVEEAEQAGLRHILFVTGKQKTSIEDHFDPDVDLVRKLREAGKMDIAEELAYQEMDVDFFFVRQSAPAGLADAIGTSRHFVGEDTFVVSLGDSIIRSAEEPSLLTRMMDYHRQNAASCTVAVEEVAPEDAHKYGIIKTAGDALECVDVADMIEKPPPGEAPSNLAIAARYVFEPEIFDAIDRTIPDRAGELQITDSIRVLLNQGRKIQCVKLREGEKRYDIGNFDTFFKSFLEFALNDDKYGYMLRQYLARELRL